MNLLLIIVQPLPASCKTFGIDGFTKTSAITFRSSWPIFYHKNKEITSFVRIKVEVCERYIHIPYIPQDQIDTTPRNVFPDIN